MIGNFFNRLFNYIGITPPEPSTQRKRSIENDITEISPIKRPRIESSALSSRMTSRDFPDSPFLNKTGTIKRSYLNSKRSSMSNDDISRLPTRNVDEIHLLYSSKPINNKNVPVVTLEDQENDIEVIENKHPQNFIRKMEPKPFHFEYNGHYSKSLSQKKTLPFDTTLMVTFDLDEKRRYNKLLASYLPFNIFRPLHENLSHPQKNSSQNLNKSTKVEVIDLENNDEVLPKKINVHPAEGTSSKPITLVEEEKSPLTQKLAKLRRVNSFEERINKTQCFHKNWISDIEKKFVEKRKEKQKLIQNELERAEILKKHNQKAILKELEERLKRSLSISQLEEITLDDQELVLPELTNKMMEEINRALAANPPNQVMVDKFNVQVLRKELHSLKGLNWLNDAVINFYMELIMDRNKTGKFLKSYCFNTFFYTRLVKCGHVGLKRWTRKIDLFSYDIICIPIHLGVHWCMAIVDFRNKSIGFYDSMGSNNNSCLEDIETYLKEEKLDKKNENFDMKDWKSENVKHIPQQMNGSDCGVFSCMFAEFLSRGASLNFSQSEMPYFRNKMVYEIIHAKLLY